MRNTKKALYSFAKGAGLTIEEWSPGDGKTRYTFYRGVHRKGCAVGISAAIDYVSAYVTGFEDKACEEYDKRAAR